ncbi:MDR family MFS transporter [Alkalicoccobacillus plakortidis]|uniref:Multidrug efflux MFS transporter n=1 Tax=Alkalicoccobacillus plakortidis TaxID=444060 RepID=A0ABT0XN78_9BACI|nr:MDR family MFS transporter [Alkalicoccobacillus plakortidis]MCM2677358.1 multidrug efflux MFS transporter [Alkalicoccobacillus plakortidis]
MNNQKKIICIVYVMAMFTVSLDTTIVNVALATISHDFSLKPEQTGMINISYLASLAFTMPAAGWLAQRYGAKVIFLFAFAGFTLASVWCGLSTNIVSLNLGRMAQGASGGLLTPVAMAILFRTFPPEERLKLSRALILPIALAPALGPIVGGFFVEYATWRLAFFINLPIGIVAILLALYYVKVDKGAKQSTFDYKGLLLAGPGLVLLMLALYLGQERGFSTSISLLLIIGLLCIAGLAKVEWNQPNPLLHVRLFTNPLYRSMTISMAACAGALLGLIYVFPLMYQQVFDATALESGLVLFPEALGLMLASQIMPYSFKRFGPKLVVQIGVCLTAIIYLLLAQISADTNPWVIRVLSFSVGVCLGHAVGAINMSAFATISKEQMGHATALFQVLSRVGSAVGVVLLSFMLALPNDLPMIGTGADVPYRMSLIAACLLLFVAFISAAKLTKENESILKEKMIQKQEAKRKTG